MQILVMSDTHSDANVIEQVKKYYPNMDAIIHCGDSELNMSHPSLSGMTVVRGNCDRDKSFPEESIVEVDGVKVYVTHGHLYNVKTSVLNLLYRGKEIGADIVLFGHSHVLGAEQIEDTLFVNPGSLLLPRGRKEKSFAIIERDEVQWSVTFYTDGNSKLSSHVFPLAENDVDNINNKDI